jgi:thiamine monophosphate kinase
MGPFGLDKASQKHECAVPAGDPNLSSRQARAFASQPTNSHRLREMLDKGQSILIHCRGGRGRAGMISARLRVESGVEPETAIERVRTGAAETRQQTGRTVPTARF